MALLGGIAGFFDKYVLGYAIGTAAGPALAPYSQELANVGWSETQLLPLDAADAATAAAENYQGGNGDAGEASLTGINESRFALLTEIARTSPGPPTLLELLRRGFIGTAEFDVGLDKARVRQEFRGPLARLRDVLLSPSDLANARQQEFIDDARLHTEGGEQGYSAERMDLLYKMAGLPPGVMDGLTMLRRGIITEATYRQLVAEGHTKTKYTDDLLALRDAILSPAQAARLRLKGWIDAAESYAIGALSGYSADQMDKLFLEGGRPATTHQVHIGFARGGRLPGAGNDERATFHKAVVESDIRPEWEDILWAQRYTYPAAFVLRALTEGGDITEAQAHDILLWEGWEPTLAATVAAKWAAKAGGTTATDAHVKKAQTNLYTTLHGSYIAEESSQTDVTPGLTALGVPAAAQTDVLSLWNIERALIRRQLSPAQIKKAVKGAVLNPATGVAWTTADAMAALLARGYDQADAQTLIEEF